MWTLLLHFMRLLQNAFKKCTGWLYPLLVILYSGFIPFLFFIGQNSDYNLFLHQQKSHYYLCTDDGCLILPKLVWCFNWLSAALSIVLSTAVVCIPYCTFFLPVTASYSNLILSAMQEYQDRTCIRFEERKYAPNYIRLFQGQG